MKNKYIMTTIGTTSIEQLPQNPQSNNNNTTPIQPSSLSNNNQNTADTQNVKIENYGQQLNAERKIDPVVQQIDYTSELNSVLKEASSVGATVLPSRDIPQNTLSMQQDENIKVNHVPNKSNDYIGDIINNEKTLKENQRKQNHSDNLDYIYEQIQLPLLIGIMYFLFQLPAVRKHFLTFLPSLFNKDGNPNVYGYIFNSVLFGLIYLLLTKGIEYLTR
tara:strand:- start:399 stop:1055 length:657 start_codon:yes stop_codon:yes gene_type:complete